MLRYLLAREPSVILASAARVASAEVFALEGGLGVVEGARGRKVDISGLTNSGATLFAGAKMPHRGAQAKY